MSTWDFADCKNVNLCRLICSAMLFDGDFLYEDIKHSVSQRFQVQQEGGVRKKVCWRKSAREQVKFTKSNKVCTVLLNSLSGTEKPKVSLNSALTIAGLLEKPTSWNRALEEGPVLVYMFYSQQHVSLTLPCCFKWPSNSYFSNMLYILKQHYIFIAAVNKRSFKIQFILKIISSGVLTIVDRHQRAVISGFLL